MESLDGNLVKAFKKVSPDIIGNFTFKLKVADSLEIFDEADIEELYRQTKGYELYLSMTLRYISTVNITLKEFVEEFKKRQMEFSDFLLSKIVSLVPSIYLPFLQNMSCLNHSVKIAFIEHYGLGDISLINYLYRKMLVSKFDDEIYLKDYLKQYFLSNLSIKEKMDNYKNLIQIYENELTKSPKERRVFKDACLAQACSFLSMLSQRERMISLLSSGSIWA